MNSHLSVGLAALVAVALAVPAFAQWNNQPYQFRSNIGGGAGMSMAYRQAIIDQELFGRRPENLVKSADGRLLEVFEHDSQAFLADPQPNFIVRRPGYAAGLNFSVGGAGGAVGGWTAMLGPSWAPRPAASPIDAWVAMLE